MKTDAEIIEMLADNLRSTLVGIEFQANALHMWREVKGSTAYQSALDAIIEVTARKEETTP